MARNTNVGGVEYDAVLKTADFKKGAREIDGAIKDVGANVEKSMGETESSVRKAAHTVAVGLAGAGVAMTAFAKSATDFTVDYVKDVRKISRETGETVEETSRLLHAFKRMGLETEQVSTSFGIFSKNVVEATQKSKEHAKETETLNIKIAKTAKELADTQAEIKKSGDESGDLTLKVRELENQLGNLNDKLKESTSPFERLGISLTDATGKQKGFSELLLEVSDRFKAMPDGVDKTALSLELFGRSGKDLLPVLNRGSEGIKALEKEADRLGLTLDANTISKVDKFIQSQKDLKDSTEAMKIQIGTLTAPVLARFNEKLNDVVTTLTNSEGPLSKVTANVLAFGGPVATTAGGLVEFAANIGGASSAAGGFSGVLSTIGSAFGWVSLAVAAGAAIYYLETRFGFFSGIWDSLQPKLVAFWVWLRDNILPILREVGGFVAGQFMAAWRDLQNAFTALGLAIAPYREELILLAKVIGVVLLVPIGFLIGAFIATVAAITAVIVIVTRLIGWVVLAAGKVAEFQTAVAQAMAGLVRSVANGVGEAIRWFNGLPGRVLGAIGNLGSVLYSAGKNLLQGFINGIKDMFGNVKSTLGDLTSKLTSWKGPLSLDKVILKQSGQAIIQGFIKGLESQYGAVQSSLGGLTESLAVGSNLTTPAINSLDNMEPLSTLGANKSVEYSIGTINIAKEVDGERWIQKLTRDGVSISSGLVPSRGYGG